MSYFTLLYSTYKVTSQRTAVKSAVKRALDIIVSITAIVLLLPFFLLAAVAIKLDSPGPVIFRKRRSGFNAKDFVFFKFRTMTVLEDGPVVTQACRDDLRVTRIGKFLRRRWILPVVDSHAKCNKGAFPPLAPLDQSHVTPSALMRQSNQAL